MIVFDPSLSCFASSFSIRPAFSIYEDDDEDEGEFWLLPLQRFNALTNHVSSPGPGFNFVTQ